MHIRVLSIKRGRKAWDFIPMIIIFSLMCINWLISFHAFSP